MISNIFLRRVLCTALVCVTPALSWAQGSSGRPIQFIVPLNAGGDTDYVARQLGKRIGESMGRTIVIENKPGAGTVIGTDAVAKAVPDGNTFGFVISNHLANPSLYSKLPYDTVKDLAPVSLVVTMPLLIVAHSGVPANNLQELVAYSKANPKGLNFGTGSVADLAHLTGERLKLASGLQMLHIPYKGGAAALTDLLSGTIHVMIGSPSQMIPHLQSGKLKAIAVTSAERSAALPNVPTVAESIGDPTFEVSSFYGMLAPAATPPEVLRRMSEEVAKALREPDLDADLKARGFLPQGSTPQVLKAYIDTGLAKTGEVVKKANIKLE